MRTLSSRRNPETSRLFRIAGYVAFVGSTSVLIMKWFMDRRVRKLDCYVKATSQLQAYKPIVELLGPPVYFGNPDLSDSSHNFYKETEAQLIIPVQGSKNRGKMYIKAIRQLHLNVDEDVLVTPNTPVSVPATWRIERIEVSIDNRPGERAVVPIEPISIK